MKRRIFIVLAALAASTCAPHFPIVRLRIVPSTSKYVCLQRRGPRGCAWWAREDVAELAVIETRKIATARAARGE